MTSPRQPHKAEPPAPERAGFLRTVRAVLWAFFGVRRGAEYERDVVRLNPVHVIIAGVIAAAVFVTVLIMIARSAAG
jgi:DUF2970 family protein